MKFSTKSRYALRMLLDLAENKDRGFISLKEIAERQNLSKQYLEQIVSLLHTSNFLRTNRGKLGGYMLAKDASEYTVGQVLRITEGGLAPVTCLESEENLCDRKGRCKTLSMWTGLYKVITDYLDNVTLQNLLDNTQNTDNYMI